MQPCYVYAAAKHQAVGRGYLSSDTLLTLVADAILVHCWGIHSPCSRYRPPGTRSEPCTLMVLGRCISHIHEW